MTLFVCYLLLLAAAMWVGRALLAHLEPALLLLAGASFAASVLIDLAIPYSPQVTAVEDGFKLYGIFAWATFALFCAWRLSAAPLPVRDASRA